jgi:hypothetical protein
MDVRPRHLHTRCSQASAAQAAADAAAAAPAGPAAASAGPAAALGEPSAELQRFVDNAYELQVPANFTFIETPVVRVERGPQPERSPVLARFEAPGGQPGAISILMRRANALKQTVFQVRGVWLLQRRARTARAHRRAARARAGCCLLRP